MHNEDQLMSDNGKPPMPDLREFDRNRALFPLEELDRYAGQHVAFSPDGKNILASGADIDEVDRKLGEAGIHFSQVVHDYIDPIE
jgi:hypothetical protein